MAEFDGALPHTMCTLLRHPSSRGSVAAEHVQSPSLQAKSFPGSHDLAFDGQGRSRHAATVASVNNTATAQSGSVQFQGTVLVVPIPPVPNAPDLLIDFLTGTTGMAGQSVIGGTTGTLDVSGGAGLFSSVVTGLNAATVADLRINGGTTTVPLAVPFLTVGGFQFFATNFPNQTAQAGQLAFGPILLAPVSNTGTSLSLGVTEYVLGLGFTISNNSFDAVFTTQFPTDPPQPCSTRSTTAAASRIPCRPDLMFASALYRSRRRICSWLPDSLASHFSHAALRLRLTTEGCSRLGAGLAPVASSA